MPRATARPKPADDSDDAPLKRLGGGRWQTRDERFMIEPQSGTWVVVDADQTDDFGMALIRGPYPSLTDAKLAIAAARTSEPAESPLTGRLERRSKPEPSATARPSMRQSAKGTSPSAPGAPTAASRPTPRAQPAPKRAPEPAEPAWLTNLDLAQRGQARRLIARLDEAGVADAVSVVRRDILGDVPAVAAIAIARRLADFGDDTPPATVAELLADGRDDALGVRWQLVDGDGRPITLESARRRR